jgi:hypothetical protein
MRSLRLAETGEAMGGGFMPKVTVTALVAAMLPACAAPAPSTPPPPDCFAPPGFYMVFGGLRRHDCAKPPKDTLVGLREVLPNSMRCGAYRLRGSVDGIGELVLDLRTTARGLSGNLLVEFPGCSAVYEAVFLRMR